MDSPAPEPIPANEHKEYVNLLLSSQKFTCLTRNDVEMKDLDIPIASRRVPRMRRMPAHFVINHAGTHDDGGEETILHSILCSNHEELELKCEIGKFTNLIHSLIEAKVAFAGAALTDRINDLNVKDPQTVHEAKSTIYWTHWLAAIYEELESLKAKGVYDEVDQLPPGRKAVESKWVLHIKCDHDGLIARFKARLVAKGFTQIPGQDFHYTFVPVT